MIRYNGGEKRFDHKIISSSAAPAVGQPLPFSGKNHNNHSLTACRSVSPKRLEAVHCFT